MVETILNGLLPVAFVIALGWLSARIGLLKHENADVLAVLVIRFALPFAAVRRRGQDAAGQAGQYRFRAVPDVRA
ncbi:MAG: AEC family transporter [Aliidongia sp.]